MPQRKINNFPLTINYEIDELSEKENRSVVNV